MKFLLEEESAAHRKKSKTASHSVSRKRSNHKHIYQKIILHYGGSTLVWGRQCELCGRVDSSYKASYWSSKDLEVSGSGFCGSWEDRCLAEIHKRYPEYTIMTLENTEWKEWSGK